MSRIITYCFLQIYKTQLTRLSPGFRKVVFEIPSIALSSLNKSYHPAPPNHRNNTVPDLKSKKITGVYIVLNFQPGVGDDFKAFGKFFKRRGKEGKKGRKKGGQIKKRESERGKKDKKKGKS